MRILYQDRSATLVPQRCHNAVTKLPSHRVDLQLVCSDWTQYNNAVSQCWSRFTETRHVPDPVVSATTVIN